MPGVCQIAAGSLASQSEYMACASGNMANALTDGYLPDNFSNMVMGGQTGVNAQTVHQFDATGPLHQTGRSHDLALSSYQDFFPLRASDGGVVYAKTVSLDTNKEGHVVDRLSGLKVLAAPLNAAGLPPATVDPQGLQPLKAPLGGVSVKATSMLKFAASCC